MTLLCKTLYNCCMTMMSFRASEKDMAAATEWAARLGIDRSDLLREALRAHLQRLVAELGDDGLVQQDGRLVIPSSGGDLVDDDLVERLRDDLRR